MPSDVIDEVGRALDAAGEIAVDAVEDGDGSDGPPDEVELANLPQNDLGNAKRLRRRYGCDIVYVIGENWHTWDRRRYLRERSDMPHEAMKLVHKTVEAIHNEANALRAALQDERDALVAQGTLQGEALAARQKADRERVSALRKWATRSGNSDKIAGALKQARPYRKRDADEMDADPYLINCANGTLELFPAAPPEILYDGCSDEGPPLPRLRDHAREDLITRLAPTEWRGAEVRGEKWERFLRLIQPEEDIRLYLQRLAGYSATADNGEQVFSIHYGNGANGKSTFVECIAGVLGDYVQTVDPRVFMSNPNADAGKANPALAKLRGIRMVSASEPSEDSKLGEDLIKAVTGGGKIAVRDLFESEKEYRPTWKLWFDTNHKPTVRGLDMGIWRRIHMVPYLVTVPKEDRVKDFHKILLAEEGPAILAWIAEGARLWREQGLAPPAKVLEAVEEYKRESDPLFDFLDSSVAEIEGERGPAAAELYTAYAYWCEQNGRTPISDNAFGRKMTRRGLPSKKSEGINRYKGLKLIDSAKPPADYLPPGKARKHGGGGGQGALM